MGLLTGPVVFLLAGLPGAGKSTYARTLEAKGILRLSVDERVIAGHGLLGRDYPAAAHFDLAAPVVAEVRDELAALVRAGRDVVLDHALDRRAVRDEYKALVSRNGGRWRLYYFKAGRDELLRRLSGRHVAEAVGEVTPQMLDWMIGQWEEPAGEGEIVIDQP
ncbi:MAG TPA: ATP-binding protein [Rugosimonospora sp.]|jgi:predicted kinase